MIKVGILTSSRADFGIYLPLLKKLKADKAFTVKLIVFGTHLSRFHGYTLTQIAEAGFTADYTLETTFTGDSPEAISGSMAYTTQRFAAFWSEHHKAFDVVLCLGDRYEMFAAVTAGIAYRIKFAHLHGGETTLGAIDNIFRHAIAHASYIHFTATEAFANRLREMLDVKDHIYNTGSLSLDNLYNMQFMSVEAFMQKWGVDFNKPTVLITFHPETVSFEKNAFFAEEIVKLIQQLPAYQFLITMPNADTAGNTIRNIFTHALTNMHNVFMVENLGVTGYFTAMKHASFLLGNTSSGIIEAASFGKYVINLGKRQEGRMHSANLLNCDIKVTAMLQKVQEIEKLGSYSGENIYKQQQPAADIMIQTLKQIFA